MSFEKIYYRGKEIQRDTTAKSAIIYTKPVRNHWWQFWRPKQKYIDWNSVGKPDLTGTKKWEEYTNGDWPDDMR